MRKVTLEIEEKLRYRRTIEVQIPDEMTESQLERLLDKAEREEYLSDFMCVLIANRIETPDGYDSDLDSPWDSEIECTDYEFEKEKAETA